MKLRKSPTSLSKVRTIFNIRASFRLLKKEELLNLSPWGVAVISLKSVTTPSLLPKWTSRVLAHPLK